MLSILQWVKYMSSTVYDSPTFRLFKNRPSFVDGAVSLVDFSENASRYNINDTEKEADYDSLASDWLAIGSDMKTAIETYELESEQLTSA